MTEDRPYWATQQHMALLAAKRDKLEDILCDTEEQFAASVSREWTAGNMTWPELGDAYQSVKDNRLPGFLQRWTDAGLPHYTRITAVLKNWPQDEDGFWRGNYPFPPGEAIPPRGISVVYVLFTDDLEPCYVGSSHDFRNRMLRHRTDGKVWSSWVAYPCRDREHAYQVEEKFLAEYMPGLNKKAGR